MDTNTRAVARPAAATATVVFGGDVMFGRRYVDADGDGDDGDALVAPDDPAGGAAGVLRHVAPLLRAADLAVVNLETTVTDAGMIHPRKPYTLRSEPGILMALADSGVGLVDLANNHVYDYTEDGLRRMLDLVDAEGLPRVGAGRDWDEAETPRIVTVNGLKIAFIAACSVTGRPVTVEGEGDATESENLPPYYTADPPEETMGQAKAGALRLDERNLVESIFRADDAGADVKVLIMHGGTQYSRDESPFLRRMAHLAIEQGVNLVVGHHPHIVQGIEVYRGAPIIFSVGNLAFDQTFPETYPALLVEARFKQGGVDEAAVRPIYLTGFVPRPLAGEDAVRALRDVAARSAALGTTLDIDAAAGRAVIRTGVPPAETSVAVAAPLYPGARSLPQPVPFADGTRFVTGIDAPAGVAVDLARPLLADSHFVADAVGDQVGWNIVGREKRVVQPEAGDPELHILRTGLSDEESTARSSGRFAVTPGTRLSLVGRWRKDDDAGSPAARIVLYADRETASVPVAVAEARGAPGDWEPFSVDVVVPPGAAFVQVALLHAAPTRGARGEVAFTGVELLQWSGPGPAGDRAAEPATYYALVGGGSASLRVAATARVAP